jgi:hypothetical protein
MEIQGVVKSVFETRLKDNCSKWELVLTVDPESSYPQFLLFLIPSDNIGLIYDLNDGDRVIINFIIRGNEWKNRYYDEAGNLSHDDTKYLMSLLTLDIRRI